MRLDQPQPAHYTPYDKRIFTAITVEPPQSDVCMTLEANGRLADTHAKHLIRRIEQHGGSARKLELSDKDIVVIQNITPHEAMRALGDAPLPFISYNDYMELYKTAFHSYPNGHGYLPNSPAEHFTRHYATMSFEKGPIEALSAQKLSEGRYEVQLQLRDPSEHARVWAALRTTGIGKTAETEKQGYSVISLRGFEKPLQALLTGDPKHPEPWISAEEYKILCTEILGRDAAWMAAHPYSTPGQRLKPQPAATQIGLFPS